MSIPSATTRAVPASTVSESAHGGEQIASRTRQQSKRRWRDDQNVSPELAHIREQQRVFLRANQKFPDFIEIGINVWESVYDWHVRHQQPLSISRNAEGRYTMMVALTTLVLRPDYISTASLMACSKTGAIRNRIVPSTVPCPATNRHQIHP